MCGIAGIWKPRYRGNELREIAYSMAQALMHRGPDDGGVWISNDSGVCLAHRRLAVVDLSPEGRQPMRSRCGRYVIAYNGEIYNYLDLRQELEHAGAVMSWRGHSDTEVVLAAIAHWGIESALQRFTGMFALAVWNDANKTLHLARDRIGEKPLYYGVVDGGVVFASELKALRRHPGWRENVDRASLSLLLRYSYVPTPRSIYSNIYKLVPGSLLTLTAVELRDLALLNSEFQKGKVSIYWSAIDVARNAPRVGYTGNEQEAEEELHEKLLSAVRGQMISDVPLGAFLSGGIDSSTVVALMQAQSAHPVRTFTIGFQEEEYDEVKHARAIARYLGTQHTELYVTPADALSVIPQLPTVYDEPFADSSQIPTLLLSRLARAHVTVSLSGDGGDELFGGYNRYFWGGRLWRKFRYVPLSLRRLIASGISAISPLTWNIVTGRLRSLMPAEVRDGNVGDKLHKLAGVLPSADSDAMYETLVSLWERPSEVVRGCPMLSESSRFAMLAHGVSRFEQRMMLVDLLTYLPDDILVKLDRAAMSVSLESRLPFLDHRVVEFAWRLPFHYKIRHDVGKWLLRRVLCRYLPRHLFERPKRGFGIPLDSWLRGSLRDWAENLLDPVRLRQEGFLEANPIRRAWEEHLSGSRNWQHHLWGVLMFQAWLEKIR